MPISQVLYPQWRELHRRHPPERHHGRCRSLYRHTDRCEDAQAVRMFFSRLKWWCKDGHLWGNGPITRDMTENHLFHMNGEPIDFPLNNVKLNDASNVMLVVQGSGGFDATGFEAKESFNVHVTAINRNSALNFENARFDGAEGLQLVLKLSRGSTASSEFARRGI